MIRAWLDVLRHLFRDRAEELLAAHQAAEAERLMPGLDMHGRWPAEYCAWPRCEWEADYVCSQHQPRGRHHAPPLTYSPVPPTVHTITDLKEQWR